MDAFFYWSGVVLWIGGGSISAGVLLLVISNRLIDFTVNSLNVKREFLAFAWERIKKRRALSAAKEDQ